MVSEIQPGQTFPAARPPVHLDTMGENNTPTALKGCGVKIVQKYCLKKMHMISQIYICMFHFNTTMNQPYSGES